MNLFNQKLSNDLKEIGINITLFIHCPHLPSDNCSCRKPKTGMLDYVEKIFGIDKDKSIFLGNGLTDMECASNFGICALKFNSNKIK